MPGDKQMTHPSILYYPLHVSGVWNISQNFKITNKQITYQPSKKFSFTMVGQI